MATTPSSWNKNTSKNSFSDFQGLWTGFCMIQDLRWEKNNLVQRISCQHKLLLSWCSLTVSLSFSCFEDTEHLKCRSIRRVSFPCCHWKFIFTFRGVVFVNFSYDLVTTDGQIIRIDFPFSLLLSFLPKLKLIETASRYPVIYLSVWYCCANLSLLIRIKSCEDRKLARIEKYIIQRLSFPKPDCV